MPCRTCLGELDSNTSLCLTEQLSIGKSVQEILQFFIPQIVESNWDNLFACSDCVENLQAFIKFIERCIAIENYFKVGDNSGQIQKAQKVAPAGTHSDQENTISDSDDDSEGGYAKIIPAISLISDTLKNRVQQEKLPTKTKESRLCSDEPGSFVKPRVTYSRKHRKPEVECPEESPDENIKHEEHIQAADSDTVVEKDVNDDEITTEDQSVSSASPFDDIGFKETTLSSPDHDLISNYDRVIIFSKPNETVDFIKSVCKTTTINNTKKLNDKVGIEENRSKRILLLGTASDINYTVESNLRKRCPLCGKQFEAITLLKRHVNQMHPDSSYLKCEKCGKQLRCLSTYIRHARRYDVHRRCNLRKCSVCKNGISSDGGRCNCQSFRALSCKICGATFGSMAHLDKHLLTHEASRKKRQPRQDGLCTICGKLVHSLKALRVHMISHDEVRPYLCDKCPKAFKTEFCLRKHTNAVHLSPTYECSICKRKTKTKSGLDFHKRLKHSNNFTHKCVICGKEFVRADYYRRHLNMHSGIVTPREYGSHRRYIKKDSNDPLYPCKFCPKKFVKVHGLRVHLLAYHLKNGAQFKCRWCNMHFGNSANRDRHEKRHQDPVAFELTCKVCYNRFDSKEKLDAHSMKHKNSKRHKCDECGDVFPSKRFLMQHKIQKHYDEEKMEKKKQYLLAEGLKDFLL